MKINQALRWIIILLGTCIAVVAFAVEVSAQSLQGFLYAKVYTENKTYTGPVRWGSEEILWTDFFNAAKTSDKYTELVPEKNEPDSWLSYDWTFSSIWENKMIVHQFTCRFGDLEQITPMSGQRARLKFRNNAELVVDGQGYNDLGSNVQVIDEKVGMTSIEWSHILKIVFLPTPERFESVFGMPLYGTVHGMRKDSFKGLIIWDNDEHLGSDKLDGTSGNSKMALRMDDIQSIRKQANGSLVTMRSGKAIFLTGSNDVNSENRGVLVITEDMGIVKVPWGAFRQADFSPAPHTGPSFDEFRNPEYLEGTVSRIDGIDLYGRIVFDIDEAVDFEFLEGADNDIEYHIPFRLIRKIIPKNYDYSMIELVSGKSLLLGGLRDVSSKNGGILVFMKGKKEPEFIPWKNIYEIVFN